MTFSDTHALVPASEAFARAAKQRDAGRWLGRDKKNRLEPSVDLIVRPTFGLEQTDRVFTIGSCFARNIEEHLERLKMDVPTIRFIAPVTEWAGRPSGILNKYTPAAVFQEVDRAARALKATTEEARDAIIYETLVPLSPDKVMDLELVSAMDRPVTMQRAKERRRDVHALFAQAFECEVATITLGLIEAWFDTVTNRYIQTAPPVRLPTGLAGRFVFKELSFEECLAFVRNTVACLNSIGPRKKIILTTSPVPLERTFTGLDILQANTYAKSLLRTVSGIVSREGAADYFPSYEMAVLTKDPAIWEDDLVHVKSDFVGKIVFKLLSAYMPSYADSLERNTRAWAQIGAGQLQAALATLADEEGSDLDDIGEALRGLALVRVRHDKEGLALLLMHAVRASLALDQAMPISAILFEQGAYEACEAVLRQSLSTPSSDPEKRALLEARLALVLSKTSRSIEATGQMEKALQIRSSHHVLNMAGQLAYEQGRLQDAERHYRAVLALMASVASIPAKLRGVAHCGLGQIELARDDWEAARKNVADALWNDPHGPAQIALSEVINQHFAEDGQRTLTVTA